MAAKPSPFPGMDPYLQMRWNTVHRRLIITAADSLAPQLADDLAARTQARVQIEVRTHREPDVAIVEQPSVAVWEASRPATTAVAEPVLLPDPGPATERWIEIVDLNAERVVTSIEILSPWNKLTAGGGRAAYLRKRQDTLSSDTNLVEVDLVRAGDWVQMMTPFHVPRGDRTTYRATVWRANPPGGPLAPYPIRLADRLPVIRVPLRPGERDVTLDLQAVIDTVYRNGRYDGTDYARPCDPPLTGDEAAWADGLLRAAGRR
jgi:hypothetical protein